ncbi:MAG: hypothetical protein C0397_09620 [Odoribacter sp.]|nr:hypothetical protein [Odoribacter sp.]
MARFSEKKIVAGSLITLGVLFSIIAAFTDCSAGGADNYAHYNIARWAFHYPNLFLDHWGKPLFTILIAPFTQIGFFGARLFNILAGLTTAWICYLLASGWKLSKAWLAPVFVIFVPIYFILMFSGMTEILFSLVLMLAIFLFFYDRFVLSAVVISFIFLARSEGAIFLPIFLTALLFKRKYVAVPFLLTGFLLFSLIGQLYYYHNFWWLITKLPYVGGIGANYGRGSWYHFLEKAPDYIGILIFLFLILGMFVWLKKWFSSGLKLRSEIFTRLLIVAGCFWGYLAAHSYIWWVGEMSLGLTRVMAGVTPVAGLIALVGWSEMDKTIKSKIGKAIFLGLTILFIVLPGVLKYKSEFKADTREVVMDEVVKWLRESRNFDHRFVAHDPYFAFSSKVDAWDSRRIQYGFADFTKPELNIADSTLLIWDAHFSQNEGHIPQKEILDNPKFELVAYFEPKVPLKVLGGHDYCVLVFRKMENLNVDNNQLMIKLKDEQLKGNLVYSEFFDFEHAEPGKVPDQFVVQESDTFSNKCYVLGKDSEFSPSVLLTDSQLKISNEVSVGVEFDFLAEDQLGNNEVLMVFSVEKEDKPYFYQGQDVLAVDSAKWNHARYHFYMPEEVKKDTKVKLYIWDIQKKNLKIDNFRVQAYSK